MKTMVRKRKIVPVEVSVNIPRAEFADPKCRGKHIDELVKKVFSRVYRLSTLRFEYPEDGTVNVTMRMCIVDMGKGKIEC